MTTVHIVGTGLVGTSVGLALRRLGVDVILDDSARPHAALARDVGAGRLPDGPVEPDLVVVATPPDVTADCVASALRRWPDAVVTDVASVKGSVLDELRAAGADLTRYVGSHPMAGRERSGPVAAATTCSSGAPGCSPRPTRPTRACVALVTSVARAAGAAVAGMDPDAHDAAVAAVSHVPQVAASLVAARLRGARRGRGRLWPARACGTSPGSRRATPACGPRSSPATPRRCARCSARCVADLDRVVGALDDAQAVRPTHPVPAARWRAPSPTETPGRPASPASTVPPRRRTPRCTVLVPDAPGELARLFADVGDAGVNLEDLHLEHGAASRSAWPRSRCCPPAAAGLGQRLEDGAGGCRG